MLPMGIDSFNWDSRTILTSVIERDSTSSPKLPCLSS
jgi:hypothetical protein